MLDVDVTKKLNEMILKAMWEMYSPKSDSETLLYLLYQKATTGY